MNYKNIATEMLKMHEGLRLKPYRCTGGRLTIGYGRNIEDRGISIWEAEYLLKEDIKLSETYLKNIFPKFYSFSDNRKAALIDMIFNLGVLRFKAFTNMIKAINQDDWEAAGVHALDSLWSKQVGERSFRIASLLMDKEWKK